MSSLDYAGRNRRLALFTGRDKAVIVDTKHMTASVSSVEIAKSSQTWDETAKAPDALVASIADAAFRAASTPGTVQALEDSFKRGFTVPTKVSATAKRAAKSSDLSPMSKQASALLAAGGQVSGADVLWVHRFFEHSTATEAGPAKWAAWGGNDARTWAANLATRLEYDSVIADAGHYSVPGLDPFSNGVEDTRAFWGRVTSHGQVDSVFRKENGSWLCWTNASWEPADEPANRVELDDETALYACGALLDAPDRPVDLRELDPTEWLVADAGRSSFDWAIVNYALRAAVDPTDGEYSPEERSENASGQLRDANGRFAKVGDSGLMKSGLRGKIATINPQGNQIVVTAEDGNSYMVPPEDFTIDGKNEAVAPSGIGAGSVKPGAQQSIPKLDLTGILGQPRATATTPKAFLKNVLQPMGAVQLKSVINDYAAFIKKERQERAKDFEGGTGWSTSSPDPNEQQKAEERYKKAQAEQIREYDDFFKKYRNKGVQADAGEPEADLQPADPILEQEGGVLGELNPESSDVKPLYLALVDPEDTRAVLELVSMVPAGHNDSAPATFKRVGGEWVSDPKVLQDLRSATPPPTILLDGEEYQSVLAQVDSQPAEDPAGEEDEAVTASATANGQVVLSLVSAGGADRNRGGAETLRRYWTKGKGGLKIRWNTGGDWRRCVRYLSKHLGPGAKGYCALRHKEMTGMWPGDKRNRKEYGMGSDGTTFSSLDDIRREPAVIRAAGYAAQVETALSKIRGDKFTPVPVRAEDIDSGRSGRAFKIPIVVPEGISSGDKRHFQKGSLGLRTFPLPLLWQPLTGEGHDGAAIVGRIDSVERLDAGLGNAYGVFDTGPYGAEAQRLNEAGMLRWVSVDLDKFEVDEDGSEIDPDGKMIIKKGRMMAATLVSKPAFQECTLELLPIEELQEGTVMDDHPQTVITAAANIAASIPVEPPKTWFDRPVLNGPTPIRVTDEGQVFGHIATWTTSHIGLPGSTRPPRSSTDYSYFHTGLVRTDSGADVKVGQLTLAGGHASMDKNAEAAAKHYDDTASALVDVHAGEDSYGIWVAGALRPGATPEQVRALRASAPSGDWRFIQGVGLELIAVCQVNVPGFPIPQSLAASGRINALVAAGTADLLALTAVENANDIKAMAAAAHQRVLQVLDVDGYVSKFSELSESERAELASEGLSMRDGSFPIRSSLDLRKAVQASAALAGARRSEARRHIVKRARALSKSDLLPGTWTEAGLTDKQLASRDRLSAMAASARARKAAELSDRVNRPSLQAAATELAARMAR